MAELVRIKKGRTFVIWIIKCLHTFLPDQGKVRIVFHMGSFEVPGWYFGCQIHNKWYFMDQLKDQQVSNCWDWANPPYLDNIVFSFNYYSRRVKILFWKNITTWWVWHRKTWCGPILTNMLISKNQSWPTPYTYCRVTWKLGTSTTGHFYKQILHAVDTESLDVCR